jgi:hypothetical protein
MSEKFFLSIETSLIIDLLSSLDLILSFYIEKGIS